MCTQPRPDPTEARHLVLATTRRVIAAPQPLDHEPRSVRPPFVIRDDRFDHMHAVDPEGWRRAVHLDRVAALLEPLAGLDLSEREHAIIEWLAGWDVSTVAPVVRLLWAARVAVPLTQPGGVTR
jgi:hypothetical protein